MRPLTLPVIAALSVACPCLLRVHQAYGAEPLNCPDVGPDWVRVTIAPPDFPTPANRLLEYLRAELAPHRIAVCENYRPSSKPPMANIRIVHSIANRVGIEVQVEDAITDKTVTRQLDLTAVPTDAHAMTIALGVAELLRASWAEVNLRRSTAARRAVPTSVRHSLDDDTKRTPTKASLGVHLAGEEFSRRLRQGGVDGRFAIDLNDTWQLTLRFGARQAASVQASDGLVRADGWLCGIGSLLRVTPATSRASLGVATHLDWAHVQFLANPRPGVPAETGSGAAVLAGMGVVGALVASSAAQFEVEVDAGGVLKGVRAMDGNQEVVAMNGVWVGASVGMSVGFW